jgi:integrase
MSEDPPASAGSTTPRSSLSFATFSARVLALYSPPLRAPATLDAMRRVLRGLAALDPPPASTEDLTTDLVVRYVAERSKTVSTNTVIGELGYVRAACSYAAEEGYLTRNPFASRRLRLRPEPPSRRKYHTVAEVARVLAHLRESSAGWEGGRLYAAASTVAYTGLRRDEALRLRVEDFRPDPGLILVVPRAGSRLKTVSSAAPVPAPPELLAVLASWAPRCGSDWLFPTRDRRRPWTGGNPGTKPLDRLKQAASAAGVEGFTWQSLRHSWATHAETVWGLSEGTIRRVLRHTTDLTQHHYRHADAANLVAATRGVSYATPLSASA